MKIKINVIQNDIDTGVRWAPTRCPIAHALRRAVPHAGYVAVTPFYAAIRMGAYYMSPRGSRFESNLPPGFEEFVRDFDNYKRVEPTTFELEFEVAND